MRGARFGLGLNIALVGVIAAAMAFLSTYWGVGVDATAGARASLPQASRNLLETLSGPIDITCYASPTSGLRPTVAAFVARYRREKSDIHLRFVDPEQDPGAMRQAGINVDGELVLEHAGQQQHLQKLSDIAFGHALARLARGGERLVAFVTGDGERRADGKANADLGDFVGQLEARGIRALPLDFTQAAAVPEHTDLVVLASPLAPLAPAVVDALLAHVASGGNVLWLDEPDALDLGLDPLRDALGIRTLPGMLVDGQGAALGIGDPRMVAVRSYPPSSITRGFDLTTLFPQVVALEAADSDWQATPILASGAQRWNETGTIDVTDASTLRHDEGGAEQAGPLAFGYALARPASGTDRHEQRVVVIGDGDFLSNSFIGNGGNRALGERVFDWLLGDDVLAALPPRAAPDRQVTVSQQRLNGIAGVFLILLPLLLLGFGMWRAWRRYRR